MATGLKLAKPLRRSPLGAVPAGLLVVLAFVAVGLLRWPLVGVVLGLAVLGSAWAWWRIRD